jgi:hypothetical protein
MVGARLHVGARSGALENKRSALNNALAETRLLKREISVLCKTRRNEFRAVRRRILHDSKRERNVEKERGRMGDAPAAAYGKI